MTSPIQIPVRFEGAEQGAALMEALTRSLGGLQQSTTAQASAAEQYAQRQASVNSAVQAGATTAAQYTQQAISFTMRLQAAASAVQSLASSFGDTNSSAGLVARTAASIAQFAQLGNMLGPGGAVAGGIVGGIIPALQSLREASDRAADSAQALNADLGTLIARAQQASQMQAQIRRLAAGQGTLEEQTAYQQQAQQRAELATAALGGDQGAIRALRRMGLTGRGDSEPSTLALAGDALGMGPAVSLDESERRMVAALFDHAVQQAEERVDLIAGTTDNAYEDYSRTQEGRTARARGSHTARAPGRGSNAGVGPMDEDYRADRAARLETEARAGVASRIGADYERFTQGRAEQDEQERHRKEGIAEAVDEINEREKHLAQERKTRAEQEIQRVEAEKRAKHAAFEQQVQGYQNVTQGVVDNIVSAGEAIATGAMSADKAFQKMLAGFLEMIAQRAALEAAANYAAAIGDAASENWGGFAMHTAAGVAWTGVAIAAGAGGAALSASAQGGSAAAGGGAPGRLPQQGGGSQQGGGTTVINFNSPVVTAGSTNELGRQLTRLVDRSRVVYPSG